MTKTTTLLAALLLLTACPGENNGVAPEKDLGPEPDMALEDADDTADMAPDFASDMPAEPGSLVIEPTQITWEGVRQDETRTATVAVSNVGGQPLTVTTVQLQEFNRRGDPEFLKGDNWKTSFTVGPGLFKDIDVTYAPNDYDLDTGQITLQTNDPDNERVEIRLTTVSAYPDIEGPSFVRFGEVGTGDELIKEVVLFNRGIDPLGITDIAIEGIEPQVFFVTPDANEPLPTILETDEDYVMQVRYAPLTTDTDRGTVVITTGPDDNADPDETTFEIALTGNDPSPCISITPRTVDLGKLAPGADGTATVTMLNCSQSLQLEVSGVELTDDGGGAFTVDGVPELPATIAPLQTAEFEVTGSLADPGTATGEIDIESNDTKTDGRIELRLSADEDN